MHISNILKEGELRETSVVKNYLITASDGKPYDTLCYSLQMFLAETQNKLLYAVTDKAAEEKILNSRS